MIQNKCQHEWRDSHNYIPPGGGSVQPMYKCNQCNKELPASEVFQLEALENQSETLKHLKGFQKYIAIVAVVISLIALVVSVLSSCRCL